MSIDGPGILDSDLAHDVYNEILDLYDAGTPLPELHRRIAKYEECFLSDVDKEIYLAASAKAYWEIGHLPTTLPRQLAQLIERGTSLSLWDGALVRARRSALDRLLRKISVPRSHPRPRRKYPKIRTKLFSVGDCVQTRTDQRTYRGVVCNILEYRGQCEYALLVTGPKTESTVESFEAGDYFGREIPDSMAERGYTFAPDVIRLEHRMLVRAGNPFEIIGHVDLDETKYILGSFSGVEDVFEDFKRIEGKREIFTFLLRPLRELMRND